MARLGEALGWKGNPLYDGLSSNRNALMQFGAGLASGTNFGEGVANGLQGAAVGAVRDDAAALMEMERAKEVEQLNKTTEYLTSQGYTDLLPLVEAGYGSEALSEAFNRQKPAAGATADWSKLNDGTLFNQRTGEVVPVGADGAGSTEYGLTPIWGQMPDGTFGYGVQGKDGTFQQVDTGTLSPLDPRTLAGERAYGTALGGAQGGAVGGAVGDISNADTALDLIDQIKTSPELPWATGRGAAMGMNNPIVNPQRFGFQNLVEQAKSGAFLTAIQDMKGLGALSNTEGSAATAAITRMNTSLSEDDFLKAVEDYEKIIKRAKERAQGRVGMQPNMNTPTAPAANSIDSLVEKYR